jgi:plastocyanin
LDFRPSNLTVVVGLNNTVTWLNEDEFSIHTVVMDTAPSGAQFSSALVVPGGTYTLTLTVPGTYKYYCEWHPAWMIGNIVVEGP